jgi:hypothetical protein
MFRFAHGVALASLFILALGCGPNGGPSTGPKGDLPQTETDPLVRAEGRKFMVASEPEGAKGVIDIRKKARDGDEVVVVGQVGGSDKPFTEGRASFLIVDPSLKPTFECDCPWDFCEYPKKELAAARLNVKFVDADGKTVRNSAREMFGIKELSQVVVKGKVSRDDRDNVVVMASSIFVRPESK